MHLIVLIFFVWMFDTYFESHKIIAIIIGSKWLFMILSYLICIKPINIFIRETLVAGKIQRISDRSNALQTKSGLQN